MTRLGLGTGREWTANSAVDSAQEALKMKGGHVVYPDKQTTFDKNEVRWWSQVSTRERMVLVVQEIRETEKGRRCQKAIVPAGTNGGMGRGLAKVLDLERYMDDG